MTTLMLLEPLIVVRVKSIIDHTMPRQNTFLQPRRIAINPAPPVSLLHVALCRKVTACHQDQDSTF